MSTNHSRKAKNLDLALLKDHNGQTITEQFQVPLSYIHSSTDLYSQVGASEETLVVDVRGSLRPAQLVETKIRTMLRNALLPFSHIRLRSHFLTRKHC